MVPQIILQAIRRKNEAFQPCFHQLGKGRAVAFDRQEREMERFLVVCPEAASRTGKMLLLMLKTIAEN